MTGASAGRRSRALVVAAACVVGAGATAWPLLDAGTAAPWWAGVVALGLLAVVLVVAAGTPHLLDARTAALIGTLAALGCVLRLVGPGAGGVELVFAVLAVGGYALGASAGLVLGVVTLLASALVTGGVGPWLPFQALAAGGVAAGAGTLPGARAPGGPGRRHVAALVGYTAVACVGYGLAMNLWSWPLTVGPGTALSPAPGAGPLENLRRFALWTLVSSAGWDVVRAVVNALLVATTARRVVSGVARARRTGRYVPGGTP